MTLLKDWFIFILLLVFPSLLNAELSVPEGYSKKEILQSIILAGDGGDIHPYAAKALQYHSGILADRLTIIFLGDNIYPSGLPEEGHPRFAAAMDSLKRQFDTVTGSKAKVIFIPGNHDWEDPNKDTRDGWSRVKNQQKEVEKHFGPGSFLPKDGCPGPVELNLPPYFRLIAMDSEWWLYRFVKPEGESSTCSEKNEDEIIEKLRKLTSKKTKSMTSILAMHHPLESFGNHKFKSYRQDMQHGLYQNLITKVESVLKDNPVDICAGGHDHSLQIIKATAGCKHSIVSGSLTNAKYVAPSDLLAFSASELGFVRLDRFKKGKIRVTVLVAAEGDGGSLREIYKDWLQ